MRQRLGPYYTTMDLKVSFKCGKCERYNSEVGASCKLGGGCSEDSCECVVMIEAKCWSCGQMNRGV